jgi:hypothetical protein
MSTKWQPWYSYFCITEQHSRCTDDTEDRSGCDCLCHEIGDDEWWEEEPPDADE